MNGDVKFECGRDVRRLFRWEARCNGVSEFLL